MAPTLFEEEEAVEVQAASKRLGALFDGEQVSQVEGNSTFRYEPTPTSPARKATLENANASSTPSRKQVDREEPPTQYKQVILRQKNKIKSWFLLPIVSNFCFGFI